MKKTLLYSLFTVFTIVSEAKYYQIETVRLKSTAGAGVASILMDESSVLNPAPLAFFSETSIYLQKGSGKIVQDTTGETQEELDQFGGAISDSQGSLKGSAGYFKQKVNRDEQSTITGSLAGNIGESSALGFNFKNKTSTSFSKETQTFSKDSNKILSAGVLHALSSEFTIGLLGTRSIAKDTQSLVENRAVAGMQYNMMEMFSIMFDLGANYSTELSSTMLYRAASQLKIFSAFYVRFGLFSDKGSREKGNGIGLAWVQPKLVLELGLSTVKDLAQVVERKTQETMFSLSYRF